MTDARPNPTTTTGETHQYKGQSLRREQARQGVGDHGDDSDHQVVERGRCSNHSAGKPAPHEKQDDEGPSYRESCHQRAYDEADRGPDDVWCGFRKTDVAGDDDGQQKDESGDAGPEYGVAHRGEDERADRHPSGAGHGDRTDLSSRQLASGLQDHEGQKDHRGCIQNNHDRLGLVDEQEYRRRRQPDTKADSGEDGRADEQCKGGNYELGGVNQRGTAPFSRSSLEQPGENPHHLLSHRVRLRRGSVLPPLP